MRPIPDLVFMAYQLPEAPPPPKLPPPPPLSLELELEPPLQPPPPPLQPPDQPSLPRRPPRPERVPSWLGEATWTKKLSTETMPPIRTPIAIDPRMNQT